MPPTAYQVLHLLSYLGYPIPGWGSPHPKLARGYPIPGWGTPLPQPDMAGGGGILSLAGVLLLPSGPGCSTPCLDLARVAPIWTWPGYPQEETWDQSLGYLPPRKDMEPVEVLWGGDGVPPGVDRQATVKTVPSRRTTYAGGKNWLKVKKERTLE